MIEWIITATLFGVFLISLCRIQYLNPTEFKLSVSVFYIALCFGCGLGALAKVAALTNWPQFAMLGDSLPVLGIFVAVLTGTDRWRHGAPEWARK